MLIFGAFNNVRSLTKELSESTTLLAAHVKCYCMPVTHLYILANQSNKTSLSFSIWAPVSSKIREVCEMHEVSHILGVLHCKWLRAANIMKCTALQRYPLVQSVHIWTPKYVRWKWQWFVCIHNGTNIMYLVSHVFRFTRGSSLHILGLHQYIHSNLKLIWFKQF